MLFELSLANGLQDRYIGSNPVSGRNEINMYNAFSNWGSRFINRYGDDELGLVDIKNSLIFALVSAGMPNDCKVMYDIVDGSIYFYSSNTAIRDYIYNNHSSYGSTTAYYKNSRSDDDNMIDWSLDDEKENESFCIKVPDELHEDFYEVLKPYIFYYFKKNIKNVSYSDVFCGNSFSSPREEECAPESDEKYTTLAKQINCTGTFWHLLCYDIFYGEIFNEIENEAPRITIKVRMMIAKVNEHFLHYGNYNYVP